MCLVCAIKELFGPEAPVGMVGEESIAKLEESKKTLKAIEKEFEEKAESLFESEFKDRMEKADKKIQDMIKEIALEMGVPHDAVDKVRIDKTTKQMVLKL